MSGFDPAVLVTAFLAGLLGSGHCFGMCGGIAGSLGALSGGTDRRSLALPAVQFNLGRLLGYAVLGAIAAGFIGAAGEIMARLIERSFLYLEAPIARVTGYDVHVPMFAREQAYLPDAERIVRTARRASSCFTATEMESSELP